MPFLCDFRLQIYFIGVFNQVILKLHLTEYLILGHAVTRFKRAQSKVRRVDIHSNIYYLIHNDLHSMYAVNPFLFV